MIQDIGEHVYHNEFEIAEPKDEDLVYVFADRKVLLKDNGTSLLTYQDARELFGEEGSYIYLVSVDQCRAFLYWTKETPAVGREGLIWAHQNVFRTWKPQWQGFLSITAASLNRWYQAHRFCGSCGHPMTKSTMERMLVCDHCGHSEYPKICPAVIVAVVDGDRIVLTKYRGRNFTKYALVAGFCEIGETLEDTVRREVMEEVGLKVKNIRYVANQPWPFTDTLLVGFRAELDGDDTIRMEEDELSVAEWVQREEIPSDEERLISLTYTMMKMFRNHEL